MFFTAYPFDCMRARNLVYVGDQDPVVRATANQSSRDAVTLEPIRDPWIGHNRQVIDYHMDDLVEEIAKASTVFVEVQRFRAVSVSPGRFDQDEPVDDVSKFMQPQL